MRTAAAAISIVLATLCMPADAADETAPESSAETVENQLHKAEERLNEAAKEVANLSMTLNGQPWLNVEPWVAGSSPRAILGINIGGRRHAPANAADGVQIISVSPGGPADIAGLKANDVIVSFAGKSLQGASGTPAVAQLEALMRDVKPAEPVTVEYRRDGKTGKAQIIPKSLSTFLAESVDHRLLGLTEDFGNRNTIVRRLDSRGFRSVELLDLSPGLAKYFGTDRGLLVVHAPADERLKLQDGDVILDIDGRVPNGVSHAFEILGSYRTGEKFTLHVMRQHKQVELPIEISQDLSSRRQSRDEVQWIDSGS